MALLACHTRTGRTTYGLLSTVLMCCAVDTPSTSAAPPARTVQLKQTSPSPADLQSWPFVTAVPLPRGGLTDIANVRLVDEHGESIPAGFGALTHWSPKRKSIKWLRVAFCAPLAAGKTSSYALIFGGDVKAPKYANPVEVAENDDAVTIDTGKIRLVIPKERGGFVSEVYRGGKVYAATPDDGPYVVDHTGAVFRAQLDEAPEVAIEESGPARAVVRVESWHMRDIAAGSKEPSPAGQRLNKCVLRYYAYAGQPWAELHWTFIITADTASAVSSSKKILATYRKGTRIPFYGKAGSYFKAQIGSGNSAQTGWVSTSQARDAATPAPQPKETWVTVTVDEARVVTKKKDGGWTTLATLKKGDKAKVIKTSEKYYWVQVTAGGKSVAGWLARKQAQ